MSSLQPPLPPAGSTTGLPDSASLAGDSSSLAWEAPRTASPVPVIVGLFFLLLSSGLWWFRVEIAQEWVFTLGYLLTPYAVFACLTWDSLWQRQGQKDPWFDVRPRYTNVLRVASLLSLAVAVLHILEISRRVGQIAIEQGWG